MNNENQASNNNKEEKRTSFQYEISDKESESENSSDEEDKPKKNVPAWAKGVELREALELQYGTNKMGLFVLLLLVKTNHVGRP